MALTALGLFVAFLVLVGEGHLAHAAVVGRLR